MSNAKPPGLTKGRQIFYLIVTFILLIATIAWRLVGTVVVEGVSMSPTLKDGQKLTLLHSYKMFPAINVGDIIVIKPSQDRTDGHAVIKRVVFIQNEDGSRPWPPVLVLPSGTQATGVLFPPQSLDCPINKPRGIYVLGDNLLQSQDSREYGPILPSDIYGKVML